MTVFTVPALTAVELNPAPTLATWALTEFAFQKEVVAWRSRFAAIDVWLSITNPPEVSALVPLTRMTAVLVFAVPVNLYNTLTVTPELAASIPPGIVTIFRFVSEDAEVGEEAVPVLEIRGR